MILFCERHFAGRYFVRRLSSRIPESVWYITNSYFFHVIRKTTTRSRYVGERTENANESFLNKCLLCQRIQSIVRQPWASNSNLCPCIDSQFTPEKNEGIANDHLVISNMIAAKQALFVCLNAMEVFAKFLTFANPSKWGVHRTGKCTKVCRREKSDAWRFGEKENRPGNWLRKTSSKNVFEILRRFINEIQAFALHALVRCLLWCV